MKTLLTLLVLVGAAVGYVACFHDDDFPNGKITCSTDTARQCPSGYYCIDNYCTQPDLLGIDATGVDIAAFLPVDGGVDAADDL